MPVQPVTLTPEEYEKLKLTLKQVNLKAQRLQTSTLQEISLRELQRRFTSFVDLVAPLKRGATQDRTSVDREWKSCRRFEVAQVRGYILRPETPPVADPVAQAELKAIMVTVGKLDNDISGGNWGNVETLCSQFQDEIEDGIRECRRITDGELREIFTITQNMNL